MIGSTNTRDTSSYNNDIVIFCWISLTHDGRGSGWILLPFWMDVNVTGLFASLLAFSGTSLDVCWTSSKIGTEIAANEKNPYRRWWEGDFQGVLFKIV